MCVFLCWTCKLEFGSIDARWKKQKAAARNWMWKRVDVWSPQVYREEQIIRLEVHLSQSFFPPLFFFLFSPSFFSVSLFRSAALSRGTSRKVQQAQEEAARTQQLQRLPRQRLPAMPSLGALKLSVLVPHIYVCIYMYICIFMYIHIYTYIKT